MSDELYEIKYKKMTTEPCEKLIRKMALPSIISMLVSAFYNLADTFFVGRINIQATGAVGVVFSYMTLIQAVSFFFGHGSGNYIARALGCKDRESAVYMASTGFFMSIITGSVIAVVCFCNIRPILKFLGATDTILPAAENYFKYILIATPFIMGSFVLNNQMRLQGNAQIGMIGIFSGAVLNLILDPLFIFAADLGVGGAAIATGISQFFSFCLLIYLSGKKDGIQVKFRNFKPSFKKFADIFSGGVPSLARQGLNSIATICLNNVAGNYGDEVIGALSIVTKVTFIANSALIGFGQGFQPVCGFNFGAKLYERVKKSFWYSVRVGVIFMCSVGIIGGICAPYIVCWFTKDGNAIELAAVAMRYQCISMPVMGFAVIGNMYLQTTRRTLSATLTAMSRQGLMYIPALFILSYFMGQKGIIITQTVADIFSCIITIPFVLKYINKND